MNSSIIKIFSASSFILFLATLFTLFFQIKEKEEMKEEMKRLKEEKIAFLSEHEECLKHKEKFLKKELFEKYIDSMIHLVNKIEKGINPSEEEISNFNDRAEFILDNIEHLEISKEVATQYLLFLSSAKKSVEQFVKKEKTENKK